MKSRKFYENYFASYPDLVSLDQFRKMLGGLGEVQARKLIIVRSINFDVMPHQLRHSYITNLLYAGVDPKTVQYLAGHENSKTTMDIYAQIKYNQPEQLYGVVSAAFSQTNKA